MKNGFYIAEFQETMYLQWLEVCYVIYMEDNQHPGKKILKPSVIHDDLPGVKNTANLRKTAPAHDDTLPENPERHYHHDELPYHDPGRNEIAHADDDVWNGEDA